MALLKGSTLIASSSDRLVFTTVAAMKAFSADNGTICYVTENGNFYGYSDKNTQDATTGYWRKFTLS